MKNLLRNARAAFVVGHLLLLISWILLRTHLGEGWVLDLVFVLASTAILLAFVRRKQRKLAGSRLLEAMLDQMPGVLFLTDAKGERLLRWNRHLETVTGLDSEALARVSPPWLANRRPAAVREHAREVFEHGAADLEGELIGRDGQRIPFLFTGHPLEMDGERYVVGIGVNISSLHETEIRLRQSVARFRNIFDVSPAGILLLDETLCIVDANLAAARMLGAARRELRGWAVAELVCHDDEADKRFVSRLRDAAESNAALEIRMQRFDGNTIQAQIVPGKLETIGEDAVQPRFMLVIEDRTLRRAYEERLEHYAATLEQLSRHQLDRLEQERREISRELHDEIGQLLTAVRLRINNALATSERDSRTQQLRQADEETGRVLDVVRRLSRTLHPTMLDDFGLAAALQWVCDSMLSALPEPPVLDFTAADLEPRPEGYIETACFRIAQEALTNILKYAKASRIRVALEVVDGGLALEVADNGEGFDVEAATADAARGRSLGLIGMRERATLAGGHLDLQSVRGKGTRVRAWIPLADRSHMDRRTDTE